jgi:hypothetical protein
MLAWTHESASTDARQNDAPGRRVKMIAPRLLRKLGICVSLIATLGLATFAGSAAAQAARSTCTPVQHGTVQHIQCTSDPMPVNICGIDLIQVDTVVVEVLTSPATGATLNPRLITSVFTNPISGKSVTQMEAGLAVSSTTDNGDGTSTDVVTVDGLTKVQVLNGPVLNINVVGSITFEVTYDTATGDFISFAFLSIKGPGPNPPSCDVLTAALT